MQPSRFIRAFLIATVIAAIPLSQVAAAGTVTITATGTTQPVGEFSGSNYAQAQGFIVTSGYLSQLTVVLSSNSGSPSGTITWEIQTDTGGTPSNTILQTGTFTPTASATNTITVVDGVFLNTSTPYQLVFKPTSSQSAGNRWNITASGSSVYADGTLSYSSSPFTSWSAYATSDISCSITTSAPTPTPTATPTATITATPTMSPTPNLSYYSTLDLGDAYRIERSATFGDLAIVSVMLVLILMITIGVIVLVTNARINS